MAGKILPPNPVMEVEIQVVLPPRTSGLPELEDFLRELTKVLLERSGEEDCWGLGGEFGYGADFENDVFMMRRFCWCEKEDCPWCGEEQRPNFVHKPSGSTVKWYKWIGRSMEVDLRASVATIRDSCLASLT